MWKINKKQLIPHQWLEFEPVDLIDVHDFPVLFTLRDTSGGLFLVYYAGEVGNFTRFIVSRTNDVILQQLLDGSIDLRESIVQPEMWAFDLNQDWSPIHCWKIRFRDIPAEILPAAGVMLRARMTPVLRRFVRASNAFGDRLVITSSPSSGYSASTTPERESRGDLVPLS